MHRSIVGDGPGDGADHLTEDVRGHRAIGYPRPSLRRPRFAGPSARADRVGHGVRGHVHDRARARGRPVLHDLRALLVGRGRRARDSARRGRAQSPRGPLPLPRRRPHRRPGGRRRRRIGQAIVPRSVHADPHARPRVSLRRHERQDRRRRCRHPPRARAQAPGRVRRARDGRQAVGDRRVQGRRREGRRAARTYPVRDAARDGGGGRGRSALTYAEATGDGRRVGYLRYLRCIVARRTDRRGRDGFLEAKTTRGPPESIPRACGGQRQGPMRHVRRDRRVDHLLGAGRDARGHRRGGEPGRRVLRHDWHGEHGNRARRAGGLVHRGSVLDNPGRERGNGRLGGARFVQYVARKQPGFPAH